MLDFYLTPENAHHWASIQAVAQGDSPEKDELLMHYVMEGIRINGTFGSYRESKVTTTIDDGGRPVEVKPGDKVFCSFVSANRDPAQFPDPLEVKTDRPLDSYIHYGIGPHKCLGMEASRVGITAMLKVVARLPNLRRAPGPQGQLKKVARAGGFYVYMTENHGSMFPFPMSEFSLRRCGVSSANDVIAWKLQFDGDLPPLPKA